MLLLTTSVAKIMFLEVHLREVDKAAGGRMMERKQMRLIWSSLQWVWREW